MKLPIQLLIKQNSDVHLTDKEETDYLIAHDDSLFDDQLRKLIRADGIELKRDDRNVRIPQVIVVQAKKNKSREPHIRRCIGEGFTYNGKHFSRFGKSSSQGKDGITLFVDDDYCDRLIEISKLGIEPDECVISKYENQRSLILSTCTLIPDRLPYIVIVDEYTYVLPDQQIRYVEEGKATITDKVTGEPKLINQRTVKEGKRDIKLSPWDGCGVHDRKLSELWSAIVGLDYTAIGYQIRLPFFKGFSVEFDFKGYYRSIGVKKIKDVFGKEHWVDDIDCIYNTSMWKGYGIFKERYGAAGWDEYLEQLELHDFKLGISKYSHHKKDFPLKTRMNFQYLQCLDLWNPKYVEWFQQDKQHRKKYDILDSSNWGNLLHLARYSTELYERIIKGDKFSTLQFLGLNDVDSIANVNGKFIEAILTNDIMLKDPAVKGFLYRKLKKSINQLKIGKAYADGYYHTVVGDIIGYLEFVAELKPVGCLKAHEFYCDTIPKGKTLSFRSPLVCPSEVNEVNVVENETTERWFGHFKDQDVVMINMHDLSLPQQGGIK